MQLDVFKKIKGFSELGDVQVESYGTTYQQVVAITVLDKRCTPGCKFGCEHYKISCSSQNNFRKDLPLSEIHKISSLRTFYNGQYYEFQFDSNEYLKTKELLFKITFSNKGSTTLWKTIFRLKICLNKHGTKEIRIDDQYGKNYLWYAKGTASPIPFDIKNVVQTLTHFSKNCFAGDITRDTYDQFVSDMFLWAKLQNRPALIQKPEPTDTKEQTNAE